MDRERRFGLSQAQILVLGAIAGLTIFLGLPIGRLRRLPLGVSALLSATATGILLFLLWDVLSAGVEPVEAALNAAAVDHDGTWLRFAALARGLRDVLRGRLDEPRLLRPRGCRASASRRAAQAPARPPVAEFEVGRAPCRPPSRSRC